MRIHAAVAEESTIRRDRAEVVPAPPDWGVAPEAPTHLPADAFDVPARAARGSKPRSASRSSSRSTSARREIITSAPRPQHEPPRVHTEEASHAYQPLRSVREPALRVAATPPPRDPRGNALRAGELPHRDSVSEHLVARAAVEVAAPPNATLISVAEAAGAPGPQAAQTPLAAAPARGPQGFPPPQASPPQVIATLPAQ